MSEQAMSIGGSGLPVSGRRALVVDSDRARARELERTMRVSISAVDHVRSVDDVDLSIPYDLVLLSHAGLEPGDCRRAFEKFSGLRERGRVLLAVRNAPRGELAELFTDHGLSNVVGIANEVEQADLLATMQKCIREDIFGIEKYFPWGTATRSYTIKSSAGRFDLVDQVCEFASTLNVAGRFVELMRGAADEMLTNALYNAPVDESSRRLFSHVARDKDVELPGDGIVNVELATDGRRIGISVSDPFGSLKAKTVIDYLGKCLRMGSDQVDDKEGGAGLGLYYVFEGLSHFIVNLQPGVRTEVIGILDVRGRYKDFAVKPKSFNVFIRH